MEGLFWTLLILQLYQVLYWTDKAFQRQQIRSAKPLKEPTLPKKRGRKPAKTLQQYKYETNDERWKMNY